MTPEECVAYAERIRFERGMTFLALFAVAVAVWLWRRIR